MNEFPNKTYVIDTKIYNNEQITAKIEAVNNKILIFFLQIYQALWTPSETLQQPAAKRQFYPAQLGN